MANNYTQFSFAIEAPSLNAAVAFEEACKPPTDPDDEDGCPTLNSLTVQREDRKLYVYSDEAVNLSESFFELLQAYLQQHDPSGAIEFTWADWCSKPRTDEFGGGAARITAQKIQTLTTYEALVHLRETSA